MTGHTNKIQTIHMNTNNISGVILFSSLAEQGKRIYVYICTTCTCNKDMENKETGQTGYEAQGMARQGY